MLCWNNVCPFVVTINDKRIANNIGNYDVLKNGANKIDWKQKHSQSITEFIRRFNIEEEQLPILFIWNIDKNNYSIVSLKQNEDIYSLIKQRIIKQNKII